jgi:hypothetical protein
MTQQPLTLNQMLQAYQQLTSDFQANRIDKVSYSAAISRLNALDAEKRWWACTPEGRFVWYDGSRWIPGEPVISAAQPPAKSAPTAFPGSQAVAPPTKLRQSIWKKLAPTPILAMLPGVVVGSIWFLYTLLQIILGKPEGVDILTPIILTGAPLLLWLLRKPLDKLMLPLQKFHASFPFALRMGVALVFPMLIGCGCSAISTYGYLALHLTALISTLFAYVMLHTPATKNFEARS